MTYVIDTNVILIANRMHEGVSESCFRACVAKLENIKITGRVALDAGREIIKEYLNKSRIKNGKGSGNAFILWLHKNIANEKYCEWVHITPHPAKGWVEFPDNEALGHFDPSDRKFVAVAAKHKEKPPILQAADSKWLGWAPHLKKHGIIVEFLCREDIERFAEKKSKKHLQRQGKANKRH
jgi:hypothetical protein